MVLTHKTADLVFFFFVNYDARARIYSKAPMSELL